MRYQHLEIFGFGTYEAFKLALGQTLHFLYAPNEAGKSTLAAFFYALFYGFPRRQKNLERDLRERYRPWRASGYGGQVSLEMTKQSLIVSRQFGESSATDTVRLVDLVTKVSRAPQDNDQLGRELFGLSAEDYLAAGFLSDRLASESAFSHWQSLWAKRQFLNQTPEYWQRIRQSLQAERRELMAYRGETGQIYTLQQRVLDLKAAYFEAYDSEKRQLVRQGELERTRARRQAAEQRLRLRELELEQEEIDDILARARRWDDLITGEEGIASDAHRQLYVEGPQTLTLPQGVQMSIKQMDELTYLADQFQEAEGRLRRAQEALASHRHALDKLHRQWASLEAERPPKASPQVPLDQRPRPQSASTRRPSGVLVAAGVTLVALILAIVSEQLRWPAVLLGGVALVFAISSALWPRPKEIRGRLGDDSISTEVSERERFLRWEWRRQQLEDELRAQGEAEVEMHQKVAEEERLFRRVRSDYLLFLTNILGRRPPDSELSQIYQNVLKASVSSEQQARRYAEREQAREGILRGQSESEFYLDVKRAEARKEELQAELQALSTALERAPQAPPGELSELLASEARLSREIELAFTQTENSASLARELRQLEGQLRVLHDRVASLDLAVEMGDLADRKMKAAGDVSLLEDASGLLSKLTGGSLSQLYSTDTRELEVADARGPGQRHEAYYSSGTRDLIHMALALAYGRKLNLEVGPLPLILDDPALRLDSFRKERLLDVLQEEAEREGRQIIYLSSDLELLNLARKRGFSCQKLPE